MSKIKELSAVHEKYTISVEHQLEPVPAVKASLIIPGENNTYTKKVSTLFVPGETLEKAEANAVSQAISMLLGNKQTKELVQNFDMFDISSTSFVVKLGKLQQAGTPPTHEFGVRTNIVVFKDMKPYRNVQSLATGTDLAEVEKEAIKSAVNKVMGVK